MEKRQTAAIVVAAGGSTRMGQPKQRIPLLGIPVIFRTLLAFEAAQTIDAVVVVARREDMEFIKAGAANFHIRKLAQVVSGGDSRQKSVAAGLEALPEGTDFVAIHDGARPLIQPEDIDRVVEAAYQVRAAAAAVRAKDTIKQADNHGLVTGTPDRQFLWTVQTPQVFEISAYRMAMKQALMEGLDFTDDCQLMEHQGFRVQLVEGAYTNLKITTPEDIVFAEALLQKKSAQRRILGMRMGHGYDVHRLTQGRKLILGGVHIPYEKGLLGHSDADVLAHAVADALLGAAALGDIGGLFPDTDPRFKDADSLMLLEETMAKVREAGYTVVNIDATILAQAPKLKPYIPEMRRKLAAACHIDMGQVSVKATTEEGLGFTGSGDGIAAHAVCLIEKAFYEEDSIPLGRQ